MIFSKTEMFSFFLSFFYVKTNLGKKGSPNVLDRQKGFPGYKNVDF